MSKTIIINEEMAGELKDLLTMTQFKFKANIKKFLASLLEDPTGAEPDMIFTQNGLDKNKLIKSLVDNKVITKKMTIDDHDENGNPHTARMIVKYSVPKERFNERLDALYDVLFPNVDARINEDGGGACAAACGGAPGDGGATSSNNSGQYGPIPLFGGLTVRKQKKNKKKIGGNPYTLNESQLLLEADDRLKKVARTIEREFNGLLDPTAPVRGSEYYVNNNPNTTWMDYLMFSLRHTFGLMTNQDVKYLPLVANLAFSDEVGFEKRNDNGTEIAQLQKIVSLLKTNPGLFDSLNKVKDTVSFSQVCEQLKPQLRVIAQSDADNAENVTMNDNYDIVEIMSYKQAHEIGNHSCSSSKLCYTQHPDTWNSFTKNGINRPYVCLCKGWENIPEVAGEGNPYDEYGTSMIFVFIDPEGNIAFSNCRWNHKNTNPYMDGGDVDHAFTKTSLAQTVGRPFTSVFKPYPMEYLMEHGYVPLNMVQTMLDNGTNPYELFDEVYEFREGFAVVQLNGKENWVTEDNRLLSNKWFGDCYNFSEGLAKVRLNNQWNWVRQDNGQLLCNQWFDDCDDFREGLAKVKLNHKYNWVRQDNGQLFSDQWYDDCDDFSDGFAVVYLNGKCNWVRQDNGQILCNQWYDMCLDFHEGLAKVELNHKYNWVRADNGQLFSEQWYDGCGEFSEGLANVGLNNKCNWIRQDNGQLFSEQWYDGCWGFHEGLAKVEKGRAVVSAKGRDIYKNGKYNWVRQDNGQLLCNQWFDKCNDFREGLAVVRLNNKGNWVRQDNGQLFSDQWYDACCDFHEGLAWVQLNGKLYCMRKDGVLFDYETKQPIQQTGLNEMVNNIVRSILSEAVTGDDGRKSSAVYAYAKNNKDEWCILAAKRNKNWDDEGGKMNPPMGHRHKYESPEDGAVRECEEESGIKFDKKDLVLASKEDWGTNFKIYLPGKTSDYKPGEGDEENTKFKWIPVSEIDKYDWAWSCGTFAKRFKPKK